VSRNAIRSRRFGELVLRNALDASERRDPSRLVTLVARPNLH
jgi:hypothetical protein